MKFEMGLKNTLRALIRDYGLNAIVLSLTEICQEHADQANHQNAFIWRMARSLFKTRLAGLHNLLDVPGITEPFERRPDGVEEGYEHQRS